ncbi:MAG TPA: DUF4124 domain-containing protein [Halomonas sp.]|nr:DUF4124 domain-containing protein [Halomonas sp.]
MSSRIAVLALGLSLSLSFSISHEARGQSIYRSTDQHGNVIFSDDPQRGGEEIHLSPLTVVPAKAPRQAAPSSTPALQSAPRPAPPRARPGQPFMPYDTFAIGAPADDHAVPVGEAGNVQVRLNIQPALREDHRVRLLLDGQISQTAMHTTTFMLSNLDRGSHQLQAELLDASGTVRHRTPARTIHVQRASIYMPLNPNNPNH